MKRHISVIVNTCDRAESLGQTLAGLQALDPAEVEVVVVNGPSSDHTEAVIGQWKGALKVGRCPTRNLSRSRNIGIRLSAGEIVAFIDDDAVPDPAWLNDLLPVFDDPEVAAVGGPVLNHTGTALQAHYIVCDRFGGADLRFDSDPSVLLNVPYGDHFCSTLGTNSLFRRDALVEIGGFDEEYEYFLDETDICVRLVDAGWAVRYGERGHVFHRYLPSHVRNDRRAISNWYPIIKNKAYFSARHGAPQLGADAAQKALDEYVSHVRHDTEWQINEGNLSFAALEALDAAVTPATLHGMRRAAVPRVSSVTKVRSGPDLPWRPFPLKSSAVGRRMHICYVSQDFPPGVIAGIARVSYELARGMAAAGHVVRAIVRSREQHHTVDWQDGVWVHRVPDATDCPPNPGLPESLWNHAVAVQRELDRIEQLRPIDVVQAPNWDCEGLAAILDGRWRTVLGVYTPMSCALEYNLDWRRSENFKRDVAGPIIDGERLCYRHASAILACGPSIVARIEHDYAVRLDGRPVGLVPHGLQDLGGAPPPPAERDVVEVLFVGRLEWRKGIDTLFDALPMVCGPLPEARFLIAGDASLKTEDGTTWQEKFLADPATKRWRDRVSFLGSVSDEELDALYRRCDIVVVPSRFESFGLPLIEAMMRSRPVIASTAGGMAEIVESESNGLLVPPEDPQALAAALRRLVVSATERLAFGSRSRELFLARYERNRMIEGALAFYQGLMEKRQAKAAVS